MVDVVVMNVENSAVASVLLFDAVGVLHCAAVVSLLFAVMIDSVALHVDLVCLIAVAPKHLAVVGSDTELPWMMLSAREAL